MHTRIIPFDLPKYRDRNRMNLLQSVYKIYIYFTRSDVYRLFYKWQLNIRLIILSMNLLRYYSFDSDQKPADLNLRFLKGDKEF